MTYNNFSQIEMHLSMDADKTFLELTKKLQCTIVVVSHKKTKVFTLNMKDDRQILHKHVLYHTGTETICLLEEAKLFNYIKSQNNFVSVIGETGKAFPEIVKTIEKGKPSVTPLLQKRTMSSKGWLVVSSEELEEIHNSTHALRWIKNFHRETGIKKAEYRLNGGVYRRLPWSDLELYWEKTIVDSTSNIVVSVTKEGLKSFFRVKGEIKKLVDKSFDLQKCVGERLNEKIKNWLEFTGKQAIFENRKSSCIVYLYLESNLKYTFSASRKVMNSITECLKPLQPEIVCFPRFLEDDLELKGTIMRLIRLPRIDIARFLM
jgi:hypothetical protein